MIRIDGLDRLMVGTQSTLDKRWTTIELSWRDVIQVTQNHMKKKDEGDIRVRSTPPFKLKHKLGKNYQTLRLQDFGFIPEVLIIERVPGGSSIVVRAVLTDDEIIKEDKILKKLNKN